MKQDILYRVENGDTVDKIASDHGVDAQELLMANHIRESNFIYAGQYLRIPRQEKEFIEFWLYFVDSIGSPIADLRVHIYSGLDEYRVSTDSFGVLPPFRVFDKDEWPRIFVEKMGGGEKLLSEIAASWGVHQLTFVSPKKR
ncbi:LysM domain-containing protein [Ralstonia sp. 25mfcol4.1]|uniref:LysM peptidoglycan-binding domain-containing protein n=1 Tax=Burkholderiaceae TaxID=119060 RepID=UPI0004920269|nr:LysM peptidoglycan-binding domain-containing protein [Ralstonia sp. 25mfcol4.1]SDP09539.1 LysM domain-containing protein [Ralstonia sp. 25mfcol4.1]